MIITVIKITNALRVTEIQESRFYRGLRIFSKFFFSFTHQNWNIRSWIYSSALLRRIPTIGILSQEAPLSAAQCPIVMQWLETPADKSRGKLSTSLLSGATFLVYNQVLQCHGVSITGTVGRCRASSVSRVFFSGRWAQCAIMSEEDAQSNFSNRELF